MNTECRCCRSSSRYVCRWCSPYSLYYCPSCKTLFSDPLPSDAELRAFYQGFLYRKPAANTLRALVQRKKREIQRLFGDAIAAGGSFLDYGGGTGVASLAAAELGLKVTLYEVDREAVAYVSSLPEKCSVRSCVDMSELHGEVFDFIWADNVIEHVKEPQSFLQSLYGQLSRGGQMIIKTPNARNTELLFHPVVAVRGYVFRIIRFNPLGRAMSAAIFRPWAIDPPRHLYAFSAESMNVLAEQVGVDEWETGYYRIPLWEYSMAKTLGHAPRGAKGVVKWLIAAMMFVPEVGSKVIEAAFRAGHITSPGGLFVRIKRS